MENINYRQCDRFCSIIAILSTNKILFRSIAGNMLVYLMNFSFISINYHVCEISNRVNHLPKITVITTSSQYQPKFYFGKIKGPFKIFFADEQTHSGTLRLFRQPANACQNVPIILVNLLAVLAGAPIILPHHHQKLPFSDNIGFAKNGRQNNPKVPVFFIYLTFKSIKTIQIEKVTVNKTINKIKYYCT